MKAWRIVVLVLLAVVVAATLYGASVIRRGFSVHKPPSAFESTLARTIRSISIPKIDRDPSAEPGEHPPATGHAHTH